MRETRRTFVMALAAATGFLATPDLLLLRQRPITPPPPPEPAETQVPYAGTPKSPGVDSARRALMLRNEREFRAGIEQLYRMASELRDEVQKIMTSDVLSVRRYKKTEAIERLAKQLKNKARG